MTKARSRPGVCTIALRRYDVFRAIQMAAEAGYSGVEIWGKPPHTPNPIDREHEEAVRQTIHDCGLTVPMFGSYVNVDGSDWKKNAKENLDISCILGAKVMRIWAGSKEPSDADQDYWQEVILRLREFCLMAADVGISLAVEMHGGTLAATVEGSERLLVEVDHPALKLN
ncbi:MAG: sugar phosphate isomerase/epimerase, partial [Armatimonadetes bacterium]|nr:sugar phosphate isomerase/epimerase [Armatimonadota bacterium]